MSLTGRSLNQYRLVGELGAGGMGTVYRARDTVLGRDAAVKVLPGDRLSGEDAKARFLREARAASALNHPNVVTVYEIGSADGLDFIAMEFVPGHTIQGLLRQRRLSVAEAAGYAFQVADALTKAHAAGIVHRDIKPGNLIVSDDGPVKVLDFGLARLHPASQLVDDNTPTDALFATREGTVLGTLAYMSPEQARGAEAGPASDIFSLGVVLFEMLSGQLPFAGTSELARLHSLHFTPPRDLRALSPDVPAELVAVVARMLEKDPGARQPSMAEIREALRPFAGMSSSSSPSAAPLVDLASRAVARRPLPRWVNRKLLIAVLAILAIGVMTVGGRRFLQTGTTSTANRALAAEGSSIDLETATPYELYVEARALLDRFDREENPARAITLLERAVEKDPAYAIGYATLTEAYRYRFRLAPDQQWRNLMTQSAARALELDPELAAAHIAGGLVLMEEGGKTAEAEAEFQRAIDLDPRNPAPHLWLAVFLSATRQTARAEESLGQVLTLDPNNWAALQELGVLRYRAGAYAEAADAWERARNASPDNARVLANLAAAYHMLDRDDDAASTLQRAIEIEPAARHYANLGTLRFFQGRYDEAIPPFEKAVELTPNRYLYWGNLADAYRWSPGHRAKARDAYAQGIQLVREQLASKPDDVDLETTLALFLAKSGETAEALKQLDRLERDPPAQPALLFRLAVTYEVAGQRDKALSALDGALRAGYSAKEVRSEPELVDLRNDVRYHRMIALYSTPGSP